MIAGDYFKHKKTNDIVKVICPKATSYVGRPSKMVVFRTYQQSPGPQKIYYMSDYNFYHYFESAKWDSKKGEFE